jgi:hypothetical protein
MKRLRVLSTGLLAVGLALVGCATRPPDSGWVSLLDGPKGLDNWNRVGTANWRLVDGVVQADQGDPSRSSFLVSKDSYRDFELRVEFWASDDANSGIYMRCANPGQPTDRTCYEANIFDQRPDPTYGTGAIVHIGKVSPMPKAGGKWNTFEITVKGTRLTVTLNGVRTAEAEDGKLAAGPVALQWGKGIVKFRTVHIKPL